MRQSQALVSWRGRLCGALITVCLLPAALHAQLPSLLDATATQIAAGQYHTCALTTAGGVKCWGSNLYGELGNTTNSGIDNANPEPVDVPGLSGVAAIAAGGAQTCALTDTGGVKCWGYNYHGELGSSTNVGTLNANPTPADVTGLTSGVAAIVVGGFHACALTTAGGVKCWGSNYSGQLGIDTNAGTNDANPTPTDLPGLTYGVVAIAAGSQHTCALTTVGSVKCWGSNYDGELGNTTNNGTDNANAAPTAVAGLDGVTAITAGLARTCALLSSGGARCWGLNNYGQLGNDTNTGVASANPVPMDVIGMSSGVAAIAAGDFHTCAVTIAGGVKCWGYNYNGQLGNDTNIGTFNGNPAPGNVAGLTSGVLAITEGGFHACALTTAGGVKCWGSNNYGELGNSTATNAAMGKPADVSGFSSSVLALATGGFHTCALIEAGVKCWGRNYNGQLGNDTNKGTYNPNPVPTDVAGLPRGATAIAAGKNHTCALTAAGGVQCWGYNGDGELGNSLTAGVAINPVPADVDGLTSDVIAIAAGAAHTCALTTANGVKCWGSNFSGQLGYATNAGTDIPNALAADVPGLTSGVAALATGGFHTCALMLTGDVKCWGDDTYGQLGNGIYFSGPNPDPADVTGLTAFGIVAGEYHTCVRAPLLTAGVKCWGWNYYGQIGSDSGADENPSPLDVVVGGPVAAIAAGGYHTCAVLAGGAQCWGYNSHGQLGVHSWNGSGTPTPVDVLNSNGDLANIAAGEYHTCALGKAGEIQCWGSNSEGELGNNNAPNASAYGAVGILSGRSIDFAPPASMAIGSSLTLSATASDGSAVVFDIWTPDTCTISNATLTATAFSLCGVRASLPGGGPDSSGNTLAGAPQQQRLIEVVPDQIFANGFDWFIIF